MNDESAVLIQNFQKICLCSFTQRQIRLILKIRRFEDSAKNRLEESATNRPRRRQNRPQITPGGSKIDPQIGKKTMKNRKIDPGASRRAKKCVSSMDVVLFWRKMAPQGGQMGPEIDPQIENRYEKSTFFSRGSRSPFWSVLGSKMRPKWGKIHPKGGPKTKTAISRK